MEGVDVVTALMEIAARTAPKAAGKDFVVIKTLKGDILKDLADKMVEFGLRTGKANFDRDGKNVAHSEAVVLIGIKDAAPVGLNCGACGFAKCLKINWSPVRVPAAGHGNRAGLCGQDGWHTERGQSHHVPRRSRGPRDGPD